MKQKRKIYEEKRHTVEFNTLRSGRFFVEFTFKKSWSIARIIMYSNAGIADDERPWNGTKTVNVNFGARMLTGIFGAWRVDLAFGLAEVSLMWKWLMLPGWDALTGISFSLIPKERVFKDGLVYRVTKNWYWRRSSYRPEHPRFRESSVWHARGG